MNENKYLDPIAEAETKDLPEHFQLFPCDEISIAVSLQHYQLKDRPNSPCRNSYPPDLQRWLKNPMEPGDFYNSILAPELPYDTRTCNKLCISNYCTNSKSALVKKVTGRAVGVLLSIPLNKFYTVFCLRD